MGLVFRLTGLTDTVEGFAADCEANWLREAEPESWSAVRHYVGLSGFLAHRLTGRWVDSTAAQVGYLPFDYKHFRWAGPGDWKWTVAPVDPAWLPELVTPTERLGGLSTTAAAHTGLPAGLPVIAAAADKACEVLGSGATTPDVLGLSYGTAATANVTSDRYVEPIPLIPPFPAAIPGSWNLETQVYRGLLDGGVVQARIRRRRGDRGGRAGGRARDALRGARPLGAARLRRPHAPAVLVTRGAHPGPGGSRRHHRLQRRPHPGARVPGDPRGSRLRAPGRCGADRETDRGAADVDPHRRRRLAEPGRGPAHGRRLRAPGRAAPTRTRRRPWARPSMLLWGSGSIRTSRPRRPRWSGPPRPATRIRRSMLDTTICSGRSTVRCTAGYGRSTASSGASPGPAAEALSRPPCERP